MAHVAGCCARVYVRACKRAHKIISGQSVKGKQLCGAREPNIVSAMTVRRSFLVYVRVLFLPACTLAGVCEPGKEGLSRFKVGRRCLGRPHRIACRHNRIAGRNVRAAQRQIPNLEHTILRTPTKPATTASWQRDILWHGYTYDIPFRQLSLEIEAVVVRFDERTLALQSVTQLNQT